MSKKNEHPMPTVTITPTARRTLSHEWEPTAYSNPEDGADGGMFLSLDCIGSEVIIAFTDFEQFKKLQAAVNAAVEEEEDLRK